MIVQHARGKPFDPSLAPTPHGIVPTRANVGIERQISEGIPIVALNRSAIKPTLATTARLPILLRQGRS